MNTTKDYALDWLRNNISKDDIIRWANDYYWNSFEKEFKEDLAQLVEDTNQEAMDNLEEGEETVIYEEDDIINMLGDDFIEALEELIDCDY